MADEDDILGSDSDVPGSSDAKVPHGPRFRCAVYDDDDEEEEEDIADSDSDEEAPRPRVFMEIKREVEALEHMRVSSTSAAAAAAAADPVSPEDKIEEQHSSQKHGKHLVEQQDGRLAHSSAPAIQNSVYSSTPPTFEMPWRPSAGCREVARISAKLKAILDGPSGINAHARAELIGATEQLDLLADIFEQYISDSFSLFNASICPKNTGNGSLVQAPSTTIESITSRRNAP